MFFVFLQFVLLFEDTHSRIQLFQVWTVAEGTSVLFQYFVDIAQRIVAVIFRLDLTVLKLLVVSSNQLGTFFTTRLSELFNVATKCFGKHLRVKALELFENCLKHELFRQSIGFNLGKRHIVELTSFRGQSIVVTNVAIVNSALCNHVSKLLHVLWALHFLILFVVRKSILRLQVAIKCDGPFTFHYEVYFCHIAFFFQDVPIFWSIFELSR